MSDIDTAVVNSLKVLDLKWPIREADMHWVATVLQEGRKTASIHASSGGIWGLLDLWFSVA